MLLDAVIEFALFLSSLLALLYKLMMRRPLMLHSQHRNAGNDAYGIATRLDSTYLRNLRPNSPIPQIEHRIRKERSNKPSNRQHRRTRQASRDNRIEPYRRSQRPIVALSNEHLQTSVRNTNSSEPRSNLASTAARLAESEEVVPGELLLRR